MTREEARKAAEVMLAYANGKEIEYVAPCAVGYCTVTEPEFNWSISNYRVKPSTKYRAFSSARERDQEMLKHQPFGWIRNKLTGRTNNILATDTHSVLITEYERTGRSCCNYNELFWSFEFFDGAPFGIKED